MAVNNLNPGDLYFNNLFNDATRVSEGGFWVNAVPVGNQGSGSAPRYSNDLGVVQAGLTADVAAGDFTGDQLTHVNTVLADLATAQTNLTGALNLNPAAQAALHAAHIDAINTINNDPLLFALSILDNNPGFNNPPPALVTPFSGATPHATFAQIGAIFDDVQNKSIGGFNAATLPGVQTELITADTALKALIVAQPQQFGGATGVHAQTIVNQLDLQINDFNHQYGTNPDAGRATNDNFLDITDIVAGDANLTNMSHFLGTNGWTPAPFTDVPTPKFQDDAAQTNFWADFIASSNTLGTQAVALSQHGTTAQVNAFITQLNGFEQNVSNFDTGQGGIFTARFANELQGNQATIGADVAAITKGLQTHNATLVQAGADGFHANAADVSGNNLPLNGGTYNADGVSIADALNMTLPPPPPATMLTPPLTGPSSPPSHDHSHDVQVTWHMQGHHDFHFG